MAKLPRVKPKPVAEKSAAGLSVDAPKPKAKKRAKKKPAKKPITVPDREQSPEHVLALPDGANGTMIPVNFLLQYAAFVDEYLKSGDCVAAGLIAGFKSDTEQGQKSIGARLLNNVHVRDMIQRQYRSIIAKTGATQERVWEEISYTAFVDIALAYDADGNPLPIPQIPEHVRRAITGYKEVEKTFGEDGHSMEKELKFGGKDAALDKLMKLHRMVDQDKLVLLDGEEFLKAMEEGRARALNRE